MVPSVWGIAGILLVFALQVTAPMWLVWDRVEASGPSEEVALVMVTSGVDVADFAVATEHTVASKSEVSVHSGYQPFEQFCASCHGLPGVDRVAGLTGSDLFDGISERPMTKESLLVTLRQGILEKGMLPMGAVLSDEQLENLVALLLEHQPEGPQNT